jgi:hypothetical protein
MLKHYFPCYTARKLLEEAIGKSAAMPTANSSSINFIVTSGSLIPSLAKCLLYRLDDVVSSENGMCPILEHIFEHLFSVSYAIFASDESCRHLYV